MPDNSEQRQEGTDDQASDSADMQLGHAIYARHARFPGLSSVGSHIVRRIAQFNAGSSSLGQRLYRRWAGGSGSGFIWPDMEWLHAYRGGQTTATSSARHAPFSARIKSYPNLETATAPILRSTEAAPAPIEPAKSSTAFMNQKSFAQKGSGVGSDSPRSKETAPLAGALDHGLTPQVQRPIVSAHVDQQNPPVVYEAESKPVADMEQKIETHSSIERQQGKQPLKADANASWTRHYKGPVYLGRAILQRSTERGRSDTKPSASGPLSAAIALPASSNPDRLNRPLSSEVEPTKSMDAGQVIEKRGTVESEPGDRQSQAPVDQSSTVCSKQPIQLSRAIPQRSNDRKPDDGAAPVAASPLDSAGTPVGAPITRTAPVPVPVLRAARSSIVPGETATHRRQAAQDAYSAESLAEHRAHPEVGESFQEPSLDAPRGDENTQAIRGATQPTIEEPQSPGRQASQSPLNAQSSNRVSPAAELPRTEGILHAIEQRPAPRVETVHRAQAKTVSRSENGADAGNIFMTPASVPLGPIVRSAKQSPGLPNASDTRRQDVCSPASSAESQTVLRGLPATRDLNLAPDRPASVFRSLALPGSATPITPAAQNFGAHVLQRHRESLITRLVDAGIGHNPDKTVVQPASALNLSESRVDQATARAGQNDEEWGRSPHISNLSHFVSSAPSAPARSHSVTGTDAVGDIPVHSALDAVGPAPEIAAQTVIQRESVMPGVEACLPVLRKKPESFDAAPTRTHRIPEVSDSYLATSSTLAALPRHLETTGGTPTAPSDSGPANTLTPSARPTELVSHAPDKEVAGSGPSSNRLNKKINPTGQMPVVPDAHGRPQAALHHLDRSAIHGPSFLEQAPRVPAVNNGHMNVPSLTVSRSKQDARADFPSSTAHRGPSLILPAAALATSREHDLLFTEAHAGSSFTASIQGASVNNLVHRSSLNAERDRMSSFRPSVFGPFRSVSLTHRAALITDGLQRSPATAASASHFLARQSDGSPAPTAIPAAVPLPSASSSTYQAGKASQSFKNVDVGQLANRVYDLLVRRLASERQRRGL